METAYPKFEMCLQLLQAGFPQKRSHGAMYYVRPDMLIPIDELSVLKSDGHTDFENIFSTLVFKPRLEDLIAETPYLEQVQYTLKSGVYTYARNDNEDALTLRATGTDLWESLCRLYLERKRVDDRGVKFDPSTSENVTITHENN